MLLLKNVNTHTHIKYTDHTKYTENTKYTTQNTLNVYKKWWVIRHLGNAKPPEILQYIIFLFWKATTMVLIT